MRKRLPVLDESVLDRVRIATPCSADWNDMRGDERVRRCDECRLDVFDLSALTRAEAVALLSRRTGRLCVRLYRRADGTVLTADCWERLRAARRRGWWALVAAIVVLVVAQIALRVGALAWIVGGARVSPLQGAVVTTPPPAPTLGEAAPLPSTPTIALPALGQSVVAPPSPRVPTQGGVHLVPIAKPPRHPNLNRPAVEPPEAKMGKIVLGHRAPATDE